MLHQMRRLLRALATTSCLASAAMLLAGCTFFGRQEPPTYVSAERGSIKDWDVRVTKSRPAPKMVKTARASPQPRPQVKPKADAAASPDLAGCGSNSECLARLKALVEDPTRSWIGQPHSPVEYANGTRLFAYRALRTRLTCDELVRALDDIAAAARTFRAPVPGVTPDRVERVRALNAEVEAELRSERAVRCRA